MKISPAGQDGVVSVDGVGRDDYGLYTDAPTGTHTVRWGAVTGLTDSSWILVAASRDSGAPFSAPIRLNGTLEHDVTGSQAAVASDGRLFIDWFDHTPSERG